MYMIVVGGGNVGLQLSKRLIAKNHEILLMEKDAKGAARLSSIIGEESVYLGDGCELITQKNAGFARADVIVACTGEDEDNLVVCQMAKSFWNVKRVLARVNDPWHEEIFQKIGVDQTVSATGIIYSLIEQQITLDEIIPVGALLRGSIEVVEAIISHRSPLVNRAVRDIQLPPQTNIIWMIREEQGMIVTGDTMILENDMIVAVVPQERASELREVLTH